MPWFLLVCLSQAEPTSDERYIDLIGIFLVYDSALSLHIVSTHIERRRSILKNLGFTGCAQWSLLANFCPKIHYRKRFTKKLSFEVN